MFLHKNFHTKNPLTKTSYNFIMYKILRSKVTLLDDTHTVLRLFLYSATVPVFVFSAMQCMARMEVGISIYRTFFIKFAINQLDMANGCHYSLTTVVYYLLGYSFCR